MTIPGIKSSQTTDTQYKLKLEALIKRISRREHQGYEFKDFELRKYES